MSSPDYIRDRLEPVTVQCSVRCGAGSKKRLNALANKHGAIMVHGGEYYCKCCQARWNWKDFSGFMDPTTVSCSNCYSDNVLIVTARMHVWTQGYPA